jgi:uncharacterized RDD family membrane protein YckC
MKPYSGIASNGPSSRARPVVPWLARAGIETASRLLNNRRLLCFFLALVLDWCHPAPVIGQADDAAQDRTPVQTNADADSTDTTARKRTSRQSLGDLTVIGNDVVVKEDETAHDVVVMGGTASIDGTVTGDLVVLMGNVRLGPKATVKRDLVVVCGALEADPAAVIGHDRVVIGAGSFTKALGLGHVPLQWLNQGVLLARPLPHQYLWSWLAAALALLLYLIIAVLFPRQVQAAVTMLEEKPGNALFAGMLAFLVAGPLLLLLAITVVGLVVVPFVAAGLVAAFLFGKVAVYRYAGQQLGAQLGWGPLQRPLFALFVGTLIFCLLYTVPVVGLLVWCAVAPLGIGAVLLAVFRPRPAVASASNASAPSAEPANVPPLLETAESNVLLPRVGFWWRLLATLLDFLLVSLVLSALFHRMRWFLLAWVVYHLILWTWRGTTIGGIVFGLKIVRTDGQPMNFAVALVRLLGGFLSAAALGLGFFWAGWSRDKQSWHDKIAGTIVVKSPGPRPLL